MFTFLIAQRLICSMAEISRLTPLPILTPAHRSGRAVKDPLPPTPPPPLFPPQPPLLRSPYAPSIKLRITSPNRGLQLTTLIGRLRAIRLTLVGFFLKIFVL